MYLLENISQKEMLIGGYNSMLEKQRKEEGEAYILTVLFDNYAEVTHDRVPIDRIKDITDKK